MIFEEDVGISKQLAMIYMQAIIVVLTPILKLQVVFGISLKMLFALLFKLFLLLFSLIFGIQIFYIS